MTKQRRRRAGNRPDPAPKLSAFTEGPAAHRCHYGPLDGAGIERLRSRVLDLLADHGVVITHRDGHEAMRRAGATEGRDASRLRLPRALVEEALAVTPKTVTLCGRTPERDITLPRGDGGFVMRTGTGAHGFVDPVDRSYRNLQIGDVDAIVAVANQLDEVGFIAHPFVYGVPELTADIHSFAAVLQRTDKHAWIQPYGKDNVAYLMRLAAAAAGGETALRARPIASCIVCSFTPLEFKVMDVEAIIQSGRYGLPIHACSLPSAGGTAPLTMPGFVLMAATEVIAMVVLAHVLTPGIPVIATPLMFTLDMRTGRALQSCAESIQAAAAAVQLLGDGFGLVTHTYGMGSDTPDVDVQSAAERAMLGQAVALAGADILGGVGQLECATVFSPVQAVLDNEAGAMLRRLRLSAPVDDESLDWEEISTIRPGGYFIDTPHTFKHCRQQLAPAAFIRDNRDGYEASGRRTALEQARDLCLDYMRRPAPANLPGEMAQREMARIVEDADREILAAARAPRASTEI